MVTSIKGKYTLVEQVKKAAGRKLGTTHKNWHTSNFRIKLASSHNNFKKLI